MNIAQALQLRGAPDSYERQENVWLLEHYLQLSSLQIKHQTHYVLSPEQEQAYVQALKRLEVGEPLAYILGSQPFWTLDLKVTPDTLVPRPDTEVLVEKVLSLSLSLQSNASILDLGTGTGAIALALASERPHWQILATDIYAPTLAVAKENAVSHGLHQVQFQLGAWYAALAATPALRFDVIVSNPPYIDAQDEHMQNLVTEPERALVAAHQGLADIEVIIQEAKAWLKTPGWVLLEHGYDQGQAVRDIFKLAGFAQIETIQDYGGNDRVTLAQFI